MTGILGAFALILAFIGFGSLPLNIAGLLLIGLAVILFVLELTVTSGGLLTIGGLVAFALGASALYTQPGDPVAPSVQVDWRIIAMMTLLTALFVIGVLIAAGRNRKVPPVNIGAGGLEQLLLPDGTPGSVRRSLTPDGTVYAMGEDWTARSIDGSVLERGTAGAHGRSGWDGAHRRTHDAGRDDRSCGVDRPAHPPRQQPRRKDGLAHG